MSAASTIVSRLFAQALKSNLQSNSGLEDKRFTGEFFLSAGNWAESPMHTEAYPTGLVKPTDWMEG